MGGSLMAKRSKNQNTLHMGDWNIICDVCGFKYKSSDIRKRWDNLYVCEDDWEPRHPMDFQKGFKDDQSVPFTRTDTVEEVVTTLGDESLTLFDSDPAGIFEWTTPLTINRFVQFWELPDQSVPGKTHTIYSVGAQGGGFILKVFDNQNQVIREMDATSDSMGVYQYNGNRWIELRYQLIGL